MIFNSLHFVFFFVIVNSLYYLLPYRYRWAWLLTASCYFYMVFKPIYILILGFTIFIDYFAGIYIEKNSGKKRKLFLIASLIANIGVLCVFKYYNFINENISLLFDKGNQSTLFPPLAILLPIGLSFHTFQAMSYTIEVYRGNQKAERHFGIYSLYVMFYPQLVAGPIERPQNVLHQFYEKHSFDIQQVSRGLKLIAWGMFKKVVIADRFAMTVNYVYGTPEHFEGFPLIIATIMFAFQIYCDFSGYSDIALGTAETLGFRLMKNFDRPYFSKSPAEFWKRWHISLSTWFRDYLYIPLGGNRVVKYRWYFNLFVTFMISGLWHGASWTYVIWGSLNGLYLIVENVSQPLRLSVRQISNKQSYKAYHKFIGVLITFSLTCFAWVFFRAKNVTDAQYILSHMFNNLGSSLKFAKPTSLGSTFYDWLVGFGALLLLLMVEYAQGKTSINAWISHKPAFVRAGLYYTLVMLILLFGVFDMPEQFIYFQF